MATKHTRGRNKKLLTYLWPALAIVTIVLIYKEQTAVLYILATLGVTAILLIVAFADLSNEEFPLEAPEIPLPQNKSDLSAFRFLCKSCCQITRFLASFPRFKPVLTLLKV